CTANIKRDLDVRLAGDHRTRDSRTLWVLARAGLVGRHAGLQMVNRGVKRQYVYDDDDSYDTLVEAEVGWREADSALHNAGSQVVRRVGSDGLTIVARVPSNGWLVMGFVEQGEEMWLLTEVRRLTDDESEAMGRMFGGRS